MVNTMSVKPKIIVLTIFLSACFGANAMPAVWEHKWQKTISGRRKAIYIANQPHAICSRNGKRAAYRIKKRLGEKRSPFRFISSS